uniref:Uncharacterized protein n=1 Tax=Knipowitschia caucasica TaxID=637954 RepID=A0AAV2LFG8_KNICA
MVSTKHKNQADHSDELVNAIKQLSREVQTLKLHVATQGRDVSHARQSSQSDFSKHGYDHLDYYRSDCGRERYRRTPLVSPVRDARSSTPTYYQSGGPPTITTASLARHRIIRTDGSHPTVGIAGSHRTIATVDIRQASTTVGSPPDLLLIETITSATRGIPHPAAQRDGVPLLVTMMTGLPLTTMTMTLLLIQVDADPPQHDRAVKDRDKMTEIST